MERKAFDDPYSDEWWFKRLFDAFHESKTRRNGKKMGRTEWFNFLWSWYLGEPPCEEHTTGWQSQVTMDVLRMGRANFAYLAVQSKLDRLKLETFRTTTTGDDADDSADSPEGVARRLMQRYTSVFDLALEYSSVMSEAYIWIGAPDPVTGLPTVTAEDPRQCVTINDPIDDTKTVAALKIYRNTLDGYDYAHVVLTDPAAVTNAETGEPVVDEQGQAVFVGERVRVARRKSTGTGVSNKFSYAAWEWVDDQSGVLPIQGRGALVHRVKAPHGLGDFEPFLDLLARINNMIVDRLWISKFQVFRQRALEAKAGEAGNDEDAFPDEDEDGNPIDWNEVLAADPGALWRLPVGYSIWESTPTELTSVLAAVKDDIKEFSAVSRTPLYALVPDAVDGSAEGATLAREGVTYKAEKWQTHQSRTFLAVCADMLAAADQLAAAQGELELVWMPAERFSLLQKAQASQYAQAAGVPWQGRMEDFLQLSPETVKRYKTQRTTDLIFQAPGDETPTTLPAGPPTAPVGADDGNA